MKACKTIFNILGILLAIIFSVLTLSFLITSPVISTGTALFQPDTLQQILIDMDLSQQLESTLKKTVPADLPELDVDFVNVLVESDLTNDLLKLYVDNLMSVLETKHMESINQTQVHQVLETHMPDLIYMIRSSLPSEVPISDTQLTDYAITTIEPVLLSMVSELPNPQDFGVNDTTLSIIHILYKGILAKFFLGLIAILSILIVLVRFPRFKGFLWLGITYLLASGILASVATQAKTFTALIIPTDVTSLLGFAINPIINLVKHHLNNGARNTVIPGIVFILIFVMGRVLLSVMKKKKHNMEIAA